MKNILTITLCLFLVMIGNNAQSHEVRVKLKPDAGSVVERTLLTMEHNLSQILNEINAAFEENREPDLSNMPIDDFAINTIMALWSSAHFYCDEDVFESRLWNMKDGYLAREIPMLIDTRDEEFGSAVFQWAVIDFDLKGRISDFRFAAINTSGESLAKGGDVADAERQMIIRQYCERFRTAYNTKDIDFLSQVFSDDALIITGKVIKVKNDHNSDVKPKSKVIYNEQSKVQYLNNLKRCFSSNRWINVKFEDIVDSDGDTLNTISQSLSNPNFYGVRLRQEWKSSNGYHDEGYIFLLWDFTNENEPIIHVRTWQPEYVGGNKIPNSEIFSNSDFGY